MISNSLDFNFASAFLAEDKVVLDNFEVEHFSAFLAEIGRSVEDSIKVVIKHFRGILKHIV
jgi:hypothetical protein